MPLPVLITANSMHRIFYICNYRLPSIRNLAESDFPKKDFNQEGFVLSYKYKRKGANI